MRMNPVLNPSNELKEKALAKIPKICRNTFYRIDSNGNQEQLNSIFDLKKGDKFFIVDHHFDKGNMEKRIFTASSNPFINEDAIPTISIKKVSLVKPLCSSNQNGQS